MLNNDTVVERNDLSAMFFPVGATLASIKLFQFAVAQVKAGDKEFKTYKCGIFELADRVGVDYHCFSNKDNFIRLTHSLDSLVGEVLDNNKKKVSTNIYLYSILRSDGKYIEFRLNNDLKKYLLFSREEDKRYIEIPLRVSKKISSSFSARLYRYIMGITYQLRDGMVCKIEMSIVEIKSLFGVQNRSSYTAYNKFDKWVLNVAVDEVNLVSNLCVRYVPIRGKKNRVEGVLFFISRGDSHARH